MSIEFILEKGSVLAAESSSPLFLFLVIPALFLFSSSVAPSFSARVCQTWNPELLFTIEAWERYLKYVNFRNQILFTEGVQEADCRDPGPRNCGSWIIYKLLMSFALWLDKLPSAFRHLRNYFSTVFLFTEKTSIVSVASSRCCVV